jgi:hypothetical protein
MQQLSMLDIMMPPPPPDEDVPTWFKTKLDKSGASYIEIGIRPNGDGTWSRATRDNLQGWCGHGGPFYGKFPTFLEALQTSIRRMWDSYTWKSADNDSVQTERHRAMGRAGLKWLDELAAQYGINMGEDT